MVHDLNSSLSDKIKRFEQLPHALKLVWESSRNWTIAGIGLMFLQGFLPLLTLYLIKLTVDAVAEGISSPHKQAAFREVLWWVFLTGLATLITAGCRALAEIVREYQGQQVADHVTDVIHGQSAEVDLAYYEDSRYHDTLFRAQQESPYRPLRIAQSLMQLCQSVISLLALAGLLLYLHWGVAGVLFTAVLPSIFFKIRYADRLYAWQLQRTNMERRAWEYHRMLTDAHHAKEVRLFDLSSVFRQRHRDLRGQLRHEKLKLARNRSTFDLIAQAGAVLSLFGMLGFIGWRTIQGAMSVGDLVMYYQAFQRAQSSLQEIMGGIAVLYEDSLFLNHLHRFLDLKSEVSDPANPVALPKPMREGIALERVCFRYSSDGRDVLKDIDLTIGPGEVVALVGDNGSGKTTLAKLLCRFYDPTEGRVTMDRVDFREFSLRALRREITMIFQDYIHYPLTARENIWVGDVGLSCDDERILKAAELSGAAGAIGRLPKGFDNVLGNRFEDGAELSIGEWQKVALARAFLRDAQLIILDEPTSAMSARAEHEIFQTFRLLLKGRSALLISHRFSTVRMADQICVLEDGRIAERGNHDELIRQAGRYARLYEMQAQYCR
jgi:ATP-binding cassette, subfamily B, bacterial